MEQLTNSEYNRKIGQDMESPRAGFRLFHHPLHIK